MLSKYLSSSSPRKKTMEFADKKAFVENTLTAQITEAASEPRGGLSLCSLLKASLAGALSAVLALIVAVEYMHHTRS